MRLAFACAFAAISMGTAFAQAPATAAAAGNGWAFESSLGYVFMGRSGLSDKTVLTPIGAPGTILTSSDFKFPWTHGFAAATLSHGAWGVDARFLGGFDWNAAVANRGVSGARVSGSMSWASRA